MSADLPLLQVLSAGAWLLACVFLVPSLGRALIGRSRASDEWRSALFFIGLIVVIGSSARAVDAAGPTWVVVYSSLILLAGYILLLLWNGRRR